LARFVLRENNSNNLSDITSEYWQTPTNPTEGRIGKHGKSVIGVSGIRNAGDEKIRNGTIGRRNTGMLEDRSGISIQNLGKVRICFGKLNAVIE
jgi:hypothetical protein